MKRIFPFIVLIVFACSAIEPVSSCTSQVSPDKLSGLDQTQLQADIKTIDNYLAAHNITAIEHPSGLRYVITKFGSGDNIPCLERAISVIYEGRVLGSGALFDSTTKPAPLVLSHLILGWQIALLEINKGTNVTLYIPSGLGYKNQESTSIPANSNLIFTIQLVDFR